MQDNTALRLINNAAASDAAAAQSLAAKKGGGRVASPKQEAAQQQFVSLNQSWGSDAVSDETRAAYMELGKSYSPSGKSSSAGKAVWVSLNMTRYHAGLDLLMTPPRSRQEAAVMPGFSLTATVSGTGVFSLRVTPEADFSVNKTLVTATNALTAGTMILRPEQFQVLEVDDNLITAGVSIGASWLDCYGRAPAVGTRVGVRLTPITPLGFLGMPVTRNVVVTALTGE